MHGEWSDEAIDRVIAHAARAAVAGMPPASLRDGVRARLRPRAGGWQGRRWAAAAASAALAAAVAAAWGTTSRDGMGDALPIQPVAGVHRLQPPGIAPAAAAMSVLAAAESRVPMARAPAPAPLPVVAPIAVAPIAVEVMAFDPLQIDPLESSAPQAVARIEIEPLLFE